MSCATHTVRTDLTEHAASVEFSAQEFTPERDFEIVCEVDHKGSDVVVVPHQRGDDGYFLAQLTPPSPEGSWQRDILPDGDPVNLLLVCDTSGSMDRQTRKTQQEFVAMILSALGKKDRFNIASCDVDTQWFSGDAMAADPESIDQVSQWLDDRPSLGWTDLDRMAQVVAKQLQNQDADQKTHVIYVGDGIATARDANPQAAAARLRRALADVKDATFHSVSIGSSFESGVLQALASVGGGSVRQIDGEQTAQRTALELLNEMMQPGLTDLKVEFRGIEVAAVYPQRLPNLAAGTQQILVGRYLPTGENQSGEIVITGKRNGEAVRYASRITMDSADASNSFIPRLWARKQLDFLLEQGSNSFIQDEVIALSEEFHIMTPYTSLLVLETDGDRARFGVKRRFQMRGGERFFAEGRSKASFELVQKQMKVAGNWRLQLRQQVLRELASLGRVRFGDRQGGPVYFGVSARPIGSQRRRGKSNHYFFSGTDADQPMGVIGQFAAETSAEISLWNGQDEANSFLSADKELESDESWLGFNDRLPDSMLESMEKSQRQQISAGARVFSLSESTPSWSSELLAEQQDASMYGADGEAFLGRTSRRGGSGGGAFGFGGYYNNYNKYTDWINQLAPTMPEAPAKLKPIDSRWNDDVNRVLKTLGQSIDFKDGQGLEIALTRKNFDPRWDRQSSGSTETQLTNGKRWLSAPVTPGGQNTIDWCNDKHRATASRPWKIGRRRASVSTDISQFQPGQRPWADDLILRSYPKWSATIDKDKEQDEKQPVITLTLTAPKNHGVQTVVFSIDTKRDVVLAMESTQDGKLVSRATYSDYIQVAGSWWPQTIKTVDDKDKLTSETKQTVKVLAEQEFADRYEALKPDEAVYQLLDFPMPTVSEARAAAAGATADFDDYLVLILDACRIQNWEMAFELLDKLEAVAAEKPCVKAIERHLLITGRRNNDALLACRVELKRLVDDVVWLSLLRGVDPDETFIALQIIAQANQFADNNERLELLDVAKPIFMRNKNHSSSLYQWQNYRVSCLQGLNRNAEAIALQRKIAEANPWQYSLLTSLAQNLSNAGEYEAGVALLEDQIQLDDKWRPYELDQFYSTAATLLRDNQRRTELAELLKRWAQTESTNEYAYAQYLSALVNIDRIEQADELAKQWFQTSMRPEKLADWESTRLRATIKYALGNGYPSYKNWMEPKWHEPLLEVAQFFLKHEHHFDIPNQFLVSSRYSWTEEAKEGLRMAAELLKKSAANMKPEKVRSLVNLLSNFEELKKDDWLEIAETLRQRWQAETDLPDRLTIGQTLTQLYSQHASSEKHIAFLETRLKQVRDEQVDDYFLQQLIDSLFAAIIKQPWNDKVEDAAFELLNQTSSSDDPAVILSTRIERLQQLNDAMKNGVFAVADTQLRSTGHPEKLTRRELAKRRTEMRQQTLEHVVARLTTEHEKLRRMRVDSIYPGLHEEFVKWMKLELMHFRVLAADKTADNLYDEDGDFGITIEACREMMGQKPVSTPVVNTDNKDANKNNYLVASERLRQERAATILSNLALRKSAPKNLADEILAYIKRGMQLDVPDADRWTDRYRMMLLALDRPEELEQNLRKSLRESKDPAPLQLMLARLLAEQGKIEDAITLAEAAQKTATLSPSDLSTLAQWYLVANRPDDYRRARLDTFAMMDEYRISQWLNQHLDPWNRTDVPLPSELDEDVLFAFEALFKKSQSPGNYCYQLRSYYAACRDFRLLRMLPDAVIGRTPQQVYPFLTELNSNVLTELRNEATMDEIVGRIDELRKSKTTSTDLRALDLLEAMVRRKGAEVLNQPGPHAKAAVAAMQRAFNRDWEEGEKLQMAEFLTNMNKITNETLAAEQLSEIRQLHAQATAGTDTHFRMSWYLAEVLGWNDQQEQAIQLMEVALREYHEKNEPGLPAELLSPFEGYVGLLESKKRYSAAEKLLLAELVQSRNSALTVQLKKRLNNSRVYAYRAGARISLGEGPELYRNLLDSLLAEANLLDQTYRFDVMQDILSMFKSKHRVKKTYKADLRKYAFEQFPELVTAIDNNYGTAIERVAKLVHDELGPRDGVAFLIERLENYPARYRATYEAGWRKHSSRLGKWRKEAETLGDLNDRLLELALAELRIELIVQDNYRAGMLYHNVTTFWSEKAEDFARTANEVAQQHNDSAAVVTRVAKYLFDGLEEHDQAISLMLDARKREILSDSQELTLVYMLRDRKRWKELVQLLEPLTAEQPREMALRSLLIKALSLSDQKDRRDEVLSETETFFRQENLWTEINVALLAKQVYGAKMYKEAVRLYDELIPMHQRARPNQSAQPEPAAHLVGGKNRLSQYYQNLARSHSRLRNTIAAVDAAAAGIVARGQNQSQRKQASLALTSVILSSRDRDGLIAHLDQQAEKTGQDSAIIRKAIGSVLLDIKEYDKAISQLQLAVELQPTDAESQQKLIKALDAAGRKDEATKQMLTQLDFDRNNLTVYKQLAERLQANDAMAERAATSIIEAAPLEAENHQALAELRQEQDRWDDAIAQWRKVAELRKLEPTGLLMLATAQVHEEKWSDAKATIKKLKRQAWPSRFNNLNRDIKQLQKKLPK